MDIGATAVRETCVKLTIVYNIRCTPGRGGGRGGEEGIGEGVGVVSGGGGVASCVAGSVVVGVAPVSGPGPPRHHMLITS